MLSIRFGLFLAQIKASLHNIKRALHANLRLNLHKLTGPRYFQMPVLLKNIKKSMKFFSQAFDHYRREIILNLAGLQLSLSRPWSSPFKESHKNGPALVLREQVSPL